MKKKLKTAAIPIVAAVLLLAILVVWFLIKRASSPPSWAVFDKLTLSMDDPQRTLILKDRKVTVKTPADEVVFETPDDWYVQNMLLEDINEDSVLELILLVWKVGSYGDHLPFWESENDQRLEQHIFIYACDHGGIYPIWMSSTVSDSITSIALVSGDILVSFRDGQTSLWGWRSWGLELLEENGVSVLPVEEGPSDTVGNNDEITFLALGDLIVHQSLIDYGLRHDGYNYLFDPMRSLISSYDVAIMNQETPLVMDAEDYSDYPLFGTPFEVADAIRKGGIDVVSLATNHMLDQRLNGVLFTEYAFSIEPAVLTVGAQQPQRAKEKDPFSVLTVKDVRFAILNYTYGTNGQPMPDNTPYLIHLLDNEEAIRKDILSAKDASDLVIVLVHWGEEYMPVPTEEQQKWADLFLSAGVDVVIGTHPHVVQPYEVLEGDDGHQMLIYYSLGNFVSGQGVLDDRQLASLDEQLPYSLSDEEKKALLILGGMATFTVRKNEDGTVSITNYDLQPLVCHQAYGLYTAYPLESYPDEMAAIHRLGITKQALQTLFTKLTKQE